MEIPTRSCFEKCHKNIVFFCELVNQRNKLPLKIFTYSLAAKNRAMLLTAKFCFVVQVFLYLVM